jgi:GT2 family glycosyltransferase
VPPRVSVVVPTWNGRHELEACLDALERQTLGDLEIVVVDNGSTDDTVDFVRREHPRARVVALASNTGFTGAANAGIDAAAGEFVALLNNDAIAEPRWAEELLGAMEHADLAASLVLRHDAPGIVDSRGEALSRWGLPYRSGRGERADAVAADGYPEIFAPTGGASIARRATLTALGGFDDRFFAYLEDVDLGLRLRTAGWRCAYEPTVARHAGQGSAGALRRPVGRFVARNTLLLVARHFPARWAGPVVYRQTAWVWHAARTGRLREHLGGLADAVPCLPGALRARRALREDAVLDVADVVPAVPWRGPRAGGHPRGGL